MGTFVIQLGTMSLQASAAVLVVLVLRNIFSMAHISKKYVMFLWVIPFLLLICPWKISSPLGLWNHAPSDYNTEYTEQAIGHITEELLTAESSMVETPLEGEQIPKELIRLEPETDWKLTQQDAGQLWNALDVVGVIWLIGMAGILLHTMVSYFMLKKKVRCCASKGNNLYTVDTLPVPMVIGIIKPHIYLPSGMEEAHMTYVAAHENMHIQRKDPAVKFIAYVIVCIHWFNPLVWAAYHFFEKDMEMACDEETIQLLGIDRKKEYATALLELSAGSRRMFAAPIAFAEGDTKNRIKNVMQYKKTLKTAAILAVAAAGLVLAVFLTKNDVIERSAIGTEDVFDSEALLEALLAEQEKLIAEQEKVQAEIEAAVKAQNGLTFDMVREAFRKQTVGDFDFQSFSNAEVEYSENDGALNYYVNFYYNYDGEEYRLGVSYWKETDEITDIYITRISDSEMARLYYTVDSGTGAYINDLETFLVTKENVNDWLTIDLPEGYTLGTYQADLGIAGGALIFPQAYELYGDDVFAPQEWYHAGFVGRIPDAVSYFIFENGKLTDGQLGWWNHSSGERLGVLDLNWQALFMQYNHDLYTAAGIGWLEEDGVDVSLIDTTSDYWYFFFAKEGEENAYYLSLSTKLFTEEEAIAIAKTVTIKE